MIGRLYQKHPYFFNFLLFNIIWTFIRVYMWKVYNPVQEIAIILKYNLIEFVFIMAICMLMTHVYRRVSPKKPVIVILAFILFTALSPSLLLLLSNGLKYFIWPEGILFETTLKNLRNATFTHLIFYIAIGGIYYVTRYRINHIKQSEEIVRAESLAKDAQLKLLRYQINPHFLFNILNSMHALIDENKEIAKKLVIDISEYYRSTLDKQIQKHAIEREIEIIEKYFEIQKIRFEDNFDYTIMVDELAKPIEVPAFIIHLLIENAIKYGLKGEGSKLIVALSITLQNNTLEIKVSNSGKIPSAHPGIFNKPAGTGSGIENIKQRLNIYYPNKFSFSLEEIDKMVVATIIIKDI